MDSDSEVRRVRRSMSERAGHDIRNLIASINAQWPEDASHTIDPGTKAERCDPRGTGERDRDELKTRSTLSKPLV